MLTKIELARVQELRRLIGEHDEAIRKLRLEIDVLVPPPSDEDLRRVGDGRLDGYQ